MNKNIRYPFVLLVSLLGSALVDIASASPIQPPRHYQPDILPVPAASNPRHSTPGYRFRPVSRHGNPYRSQVRTFGRYYGAVMPPPYTYPPQFRPAQFYLPRFADRNAWKTAGQAFPHADHLPTHYLRQTAGFPDPEWSRPPTPAISSTFGQRGYSQPGRPWFGAGRPGGQPGYFGRFRPLASARPAPSGRLASHWGGRPPAFQRPARRPYIAPGFSTRFRQAPMDPTHSTPVYTGLRNLADSQRYPIVRTMRHAPLKQRLVASRQRNHFFSGQFPQTGIPTPLPPRFAASVHTRNSDFVRGQVRQYRFRPDYRKAVSQAAASTMGVGYLPPAESFYYRARRASAGFRFRPDSRFSRMLSSASLHLPRIIATSSGPGNTGYLPDGLTKFSATGLRSLQFQFTDPADAADLYDRSRRYPTRSKRIYEFRPIAENTTG